MTIARTKAFAALFAAGSLIVASSAAMAATTKTTAQNVAAAATTLAADVAKAQKDAKALATADTGVGSKQAQYALDQANLNLIKTDKTALQTKESAAVKAYKTSPLSQTVSKAAETSLQKALQAALTSNGVGTTTANTIQLASTTGTGMTTYAFVIPSADYTKVKDPLTSTGINYLVNYWTGVVATDKASISGSAVTLIDTALAAELKSKASTCALFAGTYVNTGTANSPVYTATCSL